ncbi:MAG: hypothetical protein EXR27_05230 [Betaproteobacteria bacterium]|nr:hypothetical protein [Betaproteobacteria bacterium]
MLVIVVRFFKLKKTTNGNWDWKEVFHVALEIVYTSSGLVILLLDGLKAYAPAIIVVYLMLVLVSAQIESMEDRFSKRATFFTHMGIIAIVATATGLYFEVVQKDLDQRQEFNREAEQKKQKSYRVIIPFEDQTLRSHVGPRLFGQRQLVSIVPVNAENAAKAKELGLAFFWSSARAFKDVEDIKTALYVPQDLVAVELVQR